MEIPTSQASSRPKSWTVSGDVDTSEGFILSNGETRQSEIIFDYGRAEGGMPFVETSQVVSNGGSVQVDIIFSETYEGLQKDTGDGPFFLFSSAMDTYRIRTEYFEPSSNPNKIQLPYAQRSQRYQRVILRSSNSSISISQIGYTQIRPPNPIVNTFSCSNQKLNKIWRDGARTVDRCTVEAGETTEAWEVTDIGTRVRGQHWAPCRQGTRWGDKTVNFEMKVETVGASWGVHMVANGLIFCLNIEKRSLAAFEGLSDSGGVFPSIPRGMWDVPSSVSLDDWVSVTTVAHGSSVSVRLNGTDVALVEDLNINPILGGSGNNTGSVAFGGPANYTSLYRFLEVTDMEGNVLYENNFKISDKARTLADFAVGTNYLSGTIDGAKRDRAVFGGDLFVMGRSIYYSTANFEAALGSIKLLTSHQTKNGYLGNLCPIQAPLDEGTSEPPTYAFYSLSYALLLVVAIKDYWMFSGDNGAVKAVFGKLENLMSFTEGFVDGRGLVVAPPPLSMDWFPLGGPIFGASAKINIAYYDALNAMTKMSSVVGVKNPPFSAQAELLKSSILSNLWNNDAGLMRMSDIYPATGLAQDINAYSITTGIAPINSKSESILAAPNDASLPLAYQNIQPWDQIKVVSPYASGFAVEALFGRNFGSAALELMGRVWGVMANESDPNYSGGHWEAMSPDGTPMMDDTSLMHGWSTWPVYLLPRYLGGIHPTEPGWSRWSVKPVFAGLETINVQLSIPAGIIKLVIEVQEKNGTGEIILRVPSGTMADVYAPEGWVIVTSDDIFDSISLLSQTLVGQNEEVCIRICKTATPVEKSPDLKRESEKSSEVVVHEEFKEQFEGKADNVKQVSIFKKLVKLFA